MLNARGCFRVKNCNFQAENGPVFGSFTPLLYPHPSSFIPHPFPNIYVSHRKTRSFGVQNTVFRKEKHICLGAERYMFRERLIGLIGLIGTYGSECQRLDESRSWLKNLRPRDFSWKILHSPC